MRRFKWQYLLNILAFVFALLTAYELQKIEEALGHLGAAVAITLQLQMGQIEGKPQLATPKGQVFF